MIDADALGARFINGQCYYASAVKSKIETAPTVDAVVVKHGHWDKHYHEFDDDCYGGEWWAKCSECGYTEGVFARGHVCSSWNYCPRCGAKMDG